MFNEYEPKCKPYLLSAFAGGQWPQARLASTRKWIEDDKCQLCHHERGTLDHRLRCSATMPAEGWQKPPDAVARWMQQLAPERKQLLVTRGLLAIKVVVPPAVCGASFTWLHEPPEAEGSDWRWYIDGSLMDEPRRFARRTGFAVVVGSGNGQLVGLGSGRPPLWIQIAAGAEAWAFFIDARMTPSLPSLVIECLEVCNTLATGRGVATGPDRRLARVWCGIFGALKDEAAVALERLIWMPAHGAVHTINNALRSDGRPISGIDWRANRLVDALAKAAAGFDRVHAHILARVDIAASMVEFAAARLGVVTPCNGPCCKTHVAIVTLGDGSEV